jgi:hypothetical protein
LATRLANTVREITLEPDSVPLQGNIKAQLEALQDQSLTSNAVVELLRNVISELPPNTSGIEIRAERADDSTGFALRVRLLSNGTLRTPQVDWRQTLRVSVDNTTLYGISGYLNIKHGRSEETYTELRAALDQALGTSTEKIVLVKLKVNEEDCLR